MKTPMLRELHRWEHGYSVLLALAFSPDGQLLASGGQSIPRRDGTSDHPIHLWHPGTGQRVASLGPHVMPVSTLAFSPTDSLLASGSGLAAEANTPNEFTVWDLAAGQAILTVTGDRNPITSLCFDPSGTTVAVAGLARPDSVSLYDLPSRWEEQRLGDLGQMATVVSFNSDGTLLAIGGSDAQLQIWDRHTTHLLQTLRGYRAIHAAAFSPDGALVAAGDAYGIIRVWEVSSGREHCTFFGPADHTVYALAFAASGSVVVGAYGEEHDHRGAVMAWTLNHNHNMCAGMVGEVVYTLAVAKDSHTLAYGGDNDTIQMVYLEG